MGENQVWTNSRGQDLVVRMDPDTERDRGGGAGEEPVLGPGRLPQGRSGRRAAPKA